MNNEVKKTASPFEITTFEQAERYAKMIAESDFAPKDYKGKPGNVMIAMQMGHELGLKPNQAIQNIAVVNGRPMVWGDAALALVINNPECGGVNEWIDGTIKGGDAVACCEVKRGDKVIRREFSVKQAIQAGLLGKNVWAAYPERMLQMRARGFALRDSFPDVLKGIYIEGELLEDEDTLAAPANNDTTTLGIEAIKKKIMIPEEATKLDPVKQEADIVDVNPETGEVIESDAGPSFDDVKALMENAQTPEELILASDVARSLVLSKEKRNELAKIYKSKHATVKA